MAMRVFFTGSPWQAGDNGGPARGWEGADTPHKCLSGTEAALPGAAG